MIRVQSFINQHKKHIIVFGIFIFSLSIFLIGNAFALLTPVKSIIITSEKTSYENKEPGSWQVEKSSKWIRKGVARVTFDVDTTLMTEDKSKDIIMVLDISSSMNGEKLNRVKEDSIELIDSVLSNQNNKMALITFETDSTIVSDFTNNKNELINQINSLEDVGSTNYYQALVNVDNILKNYQKEDGREVIVLFLTDGYPNVDIPNQIGEYQYLKKAYPYLTVNGIQYEMGSAILDPIKEISDSQFHADMETLNNVLFDASVAPNSYDEFKIIDYIDNDYFTLKSEDDITVSEGNVKLEEEDGKQKITWTIPSLKSGRDAKLTMDIALKDEYIGQGGVYPTNESEEIISKIVNNPDEDVRSTKTPILPDNYKVIYDGNAPDGCSVSNLESDTNYSVFDTVSITTKKPNCTGYEFKGWEIITKDVTRVGDDYFIMPEKDVVIRAKWSKVEIAKSMEGTVNTKGNSIMKAYGPSSNTDYHNSAYRSKVTSIITKDNLEIPTTAIEYWDVSEAGDGSVIAYIEDDGTGRGTYKVTIGGEGGIIANPDSGFLFYGTYSDSFSSLKSIDLTYLDTSQVTNMLAIFVGCTSLTSLDVSNFDTSKVTDMGSMFVGCVSLTSLDVSNFDTSNVTNMNNMFSSCASLTNLDVSNFDTSNVTNMNNMFSSCESLTSLDVSNFDTSNVTDMGSMFSNCTNLTSLDLSTFNTSKVTDMSRMFRFCASLTNLDVSNFDTSNVTNMSNMFYHCESLTSLNVSGFNTSNVTDMSWMFSDCRSLTSLDVSNFNTSKVTDMNSMFDFCSSLTSLDVSNFNTSKVTDMSSMFFYTNLTSLDVSNFDTSNVTEMNSMFSLCQSLTSLDLRNFDTSKVTDMSSMFEFCISLTSLDMRNADFSSVTSYGSMFSGVNSNTNINVIVKDSKAESFVRARLDDAGRPNATVTIASAI